MSHDHIEQAEAHPRIETNLSNRLIALIGAPTDAGASQLGAAMGPDALRVAQLPQALAQMGLDVLDTGNLSGPINPRGDRDPAHDGLRNLDECIIWNRKVYEAMLAQFKAGRMPILLGGDHHLAAGSISAVARHCRESGKKLKVLWLDAHSDCNTPEISPSGNVHGTPVASLCGLGPESLASLSGLTPALSPEQFCQVGLRSVDDHEKWMIRKLGLRAFDMRSIDELGMREVMQRALDDVDDNTHLHVSFDVDFLDPEIAPGTGTDVPGGPSYREAQLCMEMIADTGRLRSLDVVELNPALDIRNKTARLVVDLVESLFGKSTLLYDKTPD
ncbi:MAG: arginase [Lautropia sp.]|nr:arginase [Lautropia sp.]